MFAEVSKTFIFDAAHKIECFGQGHKCGRLHGHTWTVEVYVAGAVFKETGIVIDYYDIMEAWAPINAALDHNFLNDIPGLEIPSTENIARFIWLALEPRLTSTTYKLVRLVIQEGASDKCVFYGAC